jgi:hypothetical protein
MAIEKSISYICTFFDKIFYKIKMENQELLQPNIEPLLEIFNETFTDKELNSMFAENFAALMT